MCGFVRARMELPIAPPNNVILRDTRDKGVHIRHWTEPKDGAVMALLET